MSVLIPDGYASTSSMIFLPVRIGFKLKDFGMNGRSMQCSHFTMYMLPV